MTQARVLRNDARILDAGAAAAAEDGWAGLALSAVARRAGLSQRPVASRFVDRSALAASVWRERAAPALLESLQDALSSAGLLQAEASPHDFQASMQRLARPSDQLRAALELLIMASFDTGLADEVGRQAAAAATDWVTPRPGQTSRALAARRAYLLIVALGLVAVSRRPGAGSVVLAEQYERLLAALGSDASPPGPAQGAPAAP